MKYHYFILCSTNHILIGVLYLISGLIGGLIGFTLSLILRLELALPGFIICSSLQYNSYKKIKASHTCREYGRINARQVVDAPPRGGVTSPTRSCERSEQFAALRIDKIPKRRMGWHKVYVPKEQQSL